MVCGTLPNLACAIYGKLDEISRDRSDNCTVKDSVPSSEMKSAIMGMSTVATVLFAANVAMKLPSLKSKPAVME